MPRYDFKCADCGKVVEFTIPSGWDIAVHCSCGGLLYKQPCAPNFSVKGFNAKNGYSR